MTTRSDELVGAARDQLRQATASMPAWVRLQLLDTALRDLRQVAATWAQDRDRLAKASGVAQSRDLNVAIVRLAAIRERHILRAMAAGDATTLSKVSQAERDRITRGLAKIATTGNLERIATTGDLAKIATRH